MKIIAIFLVFIFCWTTSTLSSFWQFQRMVRHITGRSAFFSYYGYGCYCGLGGRGTPVDATDRCCWAHDCCYHKLKEHGCQPILNGYQFSIVNGTVACRCLPGGRCLCGQKACECDKLSAYCFKENLDTYEKAFRSAFCKPAGRKKAGLVSQKAGCHCNDNVHHCHKDVMAKMT